MHIISLMVRLPYLSEPIHTDYLHTPSPCPLCVYTLPLSGLGSTSFCASTYP